VPHFDGEPLAIALTAAGIAYRYLGKELGGRPSRKEFYDERGRVVYERVAGSAAFRRGIERLRWLVERSCVAVLCSEEDPTRCHRRRLLGPAVAAQRLVLGHIRADGGVETEGSLAGSVVDGEGLADHVQIRLV
jgi:uncharacterized protein (DUF488 family)